MKKIKSFFETPQKAAAFIGCMIAIIAVLGTGTILAANAFAENSAIGGENARNFAFADAGIDPVSAQIVRTEFGFEQQQFVYEVEFIANGIEYEYWIRASDGAVVKKEIEAAAYDGTAAAVTAQITLDTAKETALSDAGLTVSEVTFTKAMLELDHDISVYDIEFYAGNAVYEYEINANTGVVYSKSKETSASQIPEPAMREQPGAGQTQGNTGQSQPVPSQTNDYSGQTQPESNQAQQNAGQQGASGQISLDEAKDAALADAGLSSSDVTYTKAQLDYEHGVSVYDIEFYTSTHKYEYEINAVTGAVTDKDMEAFQTGTGSASGNNESTGSYIGVDSAKSIAVSHAGFTVSDVTFSKAELDHDDGYVVYEIEFYQGGMEYEYKINAITGEILEFESDWD